MAQEKVYYGFDEDQASRHDISRDDDAAWVLSGGEKLSLI